MNTVRELVAQASSVGLVTPREVRDGVVSIRDESRNNHVHAIMVRNHPVGYVKQRGWASLLDGDDVINRERTNLRYLRDVDLGPRLLPDQPGDGLWVGVVKGVGLAEQRGNLPELTEVCQAWGVAVAELHGLRTTSAGLIQAPRPWVLQPSHRSRSMHDVGSASGYAAVLKAVDNEPVLRAAADQVEQRWANRYWIHGDLSATNVLVERVPSLRVRFIDFESAGIGDPAWDLATALDTIAWLTPIWHSSAEPLKEFFLRGYTRAGGTGRLYPAMQAVRSLATAWQAASHLDDGSQPREPEVVLAEVHHWLNRARGYAARASAASPVTFSMAG
jgi:aminoglycoside phosphotransferase